MTMNLWKQLQKFNVIATRKTSHKNNLKLLYFLSILAQYLQNCFMFHK